MFKRSLFTTARCLQLESKKPFSDAWVKILESSDAAQPLKIHQIMSQTFETLGQNVVPINIHKKFVPSYEYGDNYDPFDFTIASALFSNRQILFPKTYNIKPLGYKYKDTFTRQGINPLDLYHSPYALSRFLTPGGKILPRSKTGLSQKNHNLVAKLIRRARAIGFLSSVHQDVKLLPSRRD